MQLLFATKIKKDPSDATTGISVLIVAAPNCDFDGDACYDIVQKEMQFIDHAIRNLHPMVTMLSSPDEVKISDQCVVAMHTWLAGDPDVQAMKL